MGQYFVDDHGVSKATLQQVAHALLPCFHLRFGCSSCSSLGAFFNIPRFGLHSGVSLDLARGLSRLWAFNFGSRKFLSGRLDRLLAALLGVAIERPPPPGNLLRWLRCLRGLRLLRLFCWARLLGFLGYAVLVVHPWPSQKRYWCWPDGSGYHPGGIELTALWCRRHLRCCYASGCRPARSAFGKDPLHRCLSATPLTAQEELELLPHAARISCSSATAIARRCSACA